MSFVELSTLVYPISKSGPTQTKRPSCKNLYRKNLYRPTSLTTTVHSSQIAMAFASPSASAPRSDATGSPSTEHSALDDAKSRLKFGARYESLQDIVKDVEFIRSGEVRSAWPVL